MRNSGVNNLQKLVFVLRILKHDILGLVDHLDQVVLFTVHPVTLYLYFEVCVRVIDYVLVL